jgi:signal transduction histidine kinase/ActR/RegA family two-component response regulator
MTLSLSPSTLDMLLPAHILAGGDGAIHGFGPSLLRHLGEEAIGKPLLDVFTIERPVGISSFADLQNEKRPILLRANAVRFLRLRGVALQDGSELRLLLGHVPDLGGKEAMHSLQFPDFGPTDGSLDVVLSTVVREGLLEDTQRLLTALEAKKAAAEAANEAKSRFLAQMSHELRTPMNGVMGGLDVLVVMGLTAEQAELATAAKKSAVSLLGQLDEILDFSRLEAGGVSLEEIPFQPLDLGREVQTLMSPLADERGIRLSLSCDNIPPNSLIGDPGRIRQILVNLISNAIKFTEQGVVSVVLGWDENGDQSNLRLTIKDTGLGIPEEALATLFDRFVQADSSTNRKHGGAGLGLAICQQLTDLMGGVISVESTEGKGSEFTVTIPATMAERPAPTTAMPVQPQVVTDKSRPKVLAPAPTQQLNILVAEDIVLNQTVIQAVLQQLGHQVTLTNDGEEVITAAETGAFDLTLMDIQMPGVDGLEATRRIRALNSPAATVPIVAMTAHAFSDDRKRCLEAGMDDFMTKPVNRTVWVKMLERSQSFRTRQAS